MKIMFNGLFLLGKRHAKEKGYLLFYTWEDDVISVAPNHRAANLWRHLEFFKYRRDGMALCKLLG